MNLFYYIVKYVVMTFDALFFRIRIRGMENFPKTGPFILASNHISYFDPPIIGSSIPRVTGFLAKQELFRNPIMSWVIRALNSIPLKRGAIDRTSVNACVESLKKGRGLIIFPEGTRSKGEQFLEPKGGVGLIAIKANCPIIPCYVHGTNKLWKCFTFRERLSITAGEGITADEIAGYSADKAGYVAIAQEVMMRIKAIQTSVLDVK